MEEMKPYTQKPVDRNIAVAVANGQFTWHSAAKPFKDKTKSRYGDFTSYSIKVLSFPSAVVATWYFT